MSRKHRQLWKTFYVPNGDDYGMLMSVWQSWPDENRRHIMSFDGTGFIETNLPVKDLRDMFRFSEIDWIDYVSDTKPSWQEDEAAADRGKK